MDWKHRYSENMPVYFQVSLNDAFLHLSEHHGDSSPGSTNRIKINDLENFYSSFSKKGCGKSMRKKG